MEGEAIITTSRAVSIPDQLQNFPTFIRTTMRDWKVHGLAVAVIKDGEIIFSQGFGLRDAAQGLEMTSRTLCPIASVTKAFTTMSVALVADDGLLDWDTPVRSYLPSFKLWDPFATERMTPRDMVTHRSGLPRHDSMWYGSTLSRQELFDRLQYLQPTSDLRSIWQYQNLMYMTAGYMTGEVAGTTWEDLVQRRIFDPLGMVNSGFSVHTMQQAPDFSRGYRKNKTKTVTMPYYEQNEALGPAGAIISNVEDLSRWLLLHLNGGRQAGTQLVSQGQIAQMHAPQMVVAGESKYPELQQGGYGLGWFTHIYRAHRIVHHGGNIDGFSTIASFMPDENLGIAVLVNMDGSPIRDILPFYVYDRFLGGDEVPWNARAIADQKELDAADKRGAQKTRMNRVQRTRPSHALPAYAGTYVHPAYGEFRVDYKDARLSVQYKRMDMHLKHYHYDTFEARFDDLDFHVLVSFTTNMRGTVDQVSVPLEPTVKNIAFDRAPDSSTRERAFLEPFTGTYDLVGNPLVVSFKGDVLQIQAPCMPAYELEPLQGTEFAFKGLSRYTIEFAQDRENRTNEAVVNLSESVFLVKRR